MFQGKVCVIVGAAQGIGCRIAEQFAACKCRMAFMDSDKQAGRLLAQRLWENFGTEVFFFHGRTCSEEDLEIFAGAVVEQFGRIDFLINNTGLNKEGLISGVDSLKDVQTVWQISVAVPCILDKMFRNYFEPGGAQVYTVPHRGFFRKEDERVYQLVKTSVEDMTRLCADSYRGVVRVNCVCAEDCRECRHSEMQFTEESGDGFAEAVRFLCEKKADFLNGKSMCVDGNLKKLLAYHGHKDDWKLRPFPVRRQ